MELAWQLLIGELNKNRTHLTFCNGNSDRVSIVLQGFIDEKEAAAWDVRHLLQDRVNDFEILRGAGNKD